MEFNTIAVCDGVTMGTEGMKASLVSREVVADSIELVVRGHLLDGVVCLVGCDKTIPRRGHGARPARRPRRDPLQRHDLPGHVQGPADATVVTVFEAIGAYRAGKITLDELYEIENAACPGAGACGGQYTANTMSMVMEFLGLCPAGLNGIPAEDPAKDAAARRSGEIVDGPGPRGPAAVRLRHAGLDRERDRLGGRDRRHRPTACCTCSRSPTSSASRSTIDEFERHRRPDPDRGRHVARRPLPRVRPVRRRRRGPGRSRELLKRGLLDGARARRSTAGRSARDRGRRRRDDRPEGHPCRSSADQADRRPGDPARLRWRRTAASSSWPATSGGQHRGPARVFESETECHEAVREQRIVAGDVVVIRYEGPVGGPGMQEMLGVTGGPRRRGPRRRRSRSSPTAGSPAATHGLMIGHVAPEAALGGPIAAVREGDTDRHRRRPRGASTSRSRPTELARRRAAGRRRRRATAAA